LDGGEDEAAVGGGAGAEVAADGGVGEVHDGEGGEFEGAGAYRVEDLAGELAQQGGDGFVEGGEGGGVVVGEGGCTEEFFAAALEEEAGVGRVILGERHGPVGGG